MLTIILIIGVIAAILTILIVLIQNPKGGGLASNFSAGNQLFGAKQTTEGVEKLTWIFVAIILVVSLAASSYNGVSKAGKGGTETTTSSDEGVNDALSAPAPKSSAPAAAPGGMMPPPAGTTPAQGAPAPAPQP